MGGYPPTYPEGGGRNPPRHTSQMTHDRALGISVNIPTKTLCLPMCLLSVSSESCIDCVGWRLTREEDGGAVTGDPPFLEEN